jgi:MFS family permease
MEPTTPKVSPWKVLLYTCAAVFAITLDSTILFVAFPAIRASYPQVSPANLSWVLNAYTIVVGAMLIPAGAYADKFGRKRIFLTGVPIFTAGSLLCGISPGGLIRLVTLESDSNFLLLWLPSAILSGVGIGMIFPSLSSSATFNLPPNRYSIGSGVNNSIRQLGSVFGIAFAVLCVGSESTHSTTAFADLYSGLIIAAVITALLGAFVRTAPVQERGPSLNVVSGSK